MSSEKPYPPLGAHTALRYAVLVDRAHLQHWQEQSIHSLSAQGDICAVVLRVVDPAQTTPRSRFWPWLVETASALGKYDGTSGNAGPRPVETGEVGPLLAEHRLDLVLDLREKATAIAIEVPTHGVWRLSFPAPPARLAAEALLRRDLTISVGLHRTARDGTAELLIEGEYGVVRTSAAKTRDRVLRGAATFPARAARTIRFGLRHSPGLGPSREYPVTPPAHLWRTRLALAMLRERAKKAVLDAVTETFWAIGVVKAPVERILDGQVTSDLFHWYPGSDRDSYLADPIPLPSDPGTVYAEEFDHMTGRGVLIATTYSETDGWSGREVVARESFHMSYPYMIEYGEETLCIPETGWNSAVSIYRKKDSPHLEKVCDILSGIAAGDPTAFQWGGYWWMFYTDCFEPRDTDLYIWYAATPWGPWEPHSRNPVKSNVSSSRPAGAPFVLGGRLMRPAQDDAGRYGWRMVVNELLELSPTEFKEVTVTEIGPFTDGPYPAGPHTLSIAGPYVYVDGKRRVVSLSLKARRHLMRLRAKLRQARQGSRQRED
ncbi:hypothetical protein [Streptomyces sp. NPDC059552]|uniref:glucosamine inositolphosphorylceramide transferase family protein n=1 Tax=Streptomyces sp. NPDC059552 TaxID=3346862 RepID=UPI003698B5CC